MTGRIHILSKPPEHARHKRCLDLLGNKDTLVLSEAALLLLERKNPLEDVKAGWVIAITETPAMLSLPEGVQAMSHAAFVEQLLTRHQPVFW